MKHLYFHSSKFEYIQDLLDDKDFERTFEYPPSEFHKSYENEFGRIRTSSNYFHFLLGSIRQRFCPWCGEKPEFKQINEVKPGDFFQYLQFSYICPKCGSRGPVINICESALVDEKFKDTLEQVAQSRYEHRIGWEEGLIKN